jgi:hypothetical protein
MVELFAMVAILGCSEAPAVRFAVDRTRHNRSGLRHPARS